MAAARRGRSTVSIVAGVAGVCAVLGVAVMRGGGLDGVELSSPGIGVAVAT